MSCSSLLLMLTAATTVNLSDAKDFFEAGQEAFAAGEFSAAASAFEQALDMIPGPGPRSDPRPAIVFSLAQAYRRWYFEELDTADRDLSALDRAVEAFRRYIVMAPNGIRRPDAEGHLATLELELARVSLLGLRRKAADEQRPTRIMITSKTPNAQASIDGTKSSTVPVVREVAPGKHVVKVTCEGFFEEEVEAEAIQGSLAVVPVNLTEKPAIVTIAAPNDAIISVDGRIVGVAPLRSSIELPAGRRLITVTQSGKQSFSKELDLVRGRTQTVVADLDPTGQRQAARYFLIGGGVVASASVVTGIVAIVSNASARVYLLRSSEGMEMLTAQDLENYISARNRYVAFKGFAVTSLIVASVVLGTGGVLWAFDSPSSASSPSMMVAPLAIPNGGGVMTSVTF